MSMKKIGSLVFGGERFDILLGRYGNHRVAVFLADHLGVMTTHVSVNVIDEDLDEDEFVLDYGVKSDLERVLLHTGLFEDTGRRVDYGYIKDQPVWRLVEMPKIKRWLN